jgi:hypothetical protein
MKKLWIVGAAGVGFVLGSRAGRQPYERLEARARNLRRNPQVQQAIEGATEVAHARTHEVADSVLSHLPSESSADSGS